MKNQTKRRGLLATTGVLVTAAALVLGGAVAATAAPTIPSTPPASTTGNLHITKLTTPDNGGDASNGMPVAAGDLPVGAEPIENVEFTVKRVTGYLPDGGAAPADDVAINLSTNAGWLAAAAIEYDAATDTWSAGGVAVDDIYFGDAQDGDTDTNGQLVFANLPIGLYFVEETDTPAGVTPAAPFLVTVPITNPVDIVGSGDAANPESPAGTTWLYDVYVYPKNAQTAFTKTVEDEDAYIGGATGLNEIEYTLNADVPRVNKGTDTAPVWADFTSYVIVDTLDANLTAPASDDVSVQLTGQTLVRGTDYTVTVVGQVVTVTFLGPSATQNGFAKLKAAAGTPGAQVTVTIPATVKAAATAGDAMDIKNGGDNKGTTLNYMVDGEPSDPQYPNEVASKFRSFNFLKKNESGENLTGAVFGLYQTEALASADAAGSALVKSAATTADGIVQFNDVRVSDFQNGAAQTAGAKANPDATLCTERNEDFRVYWLAETVAPDGYELLARPIPVVLTGATPGVLQQVEVDGAGYAQFNDDCSVKTVANPLSQITNVPANAGFVLPLTGGMGTALLTIGGIAILAIVLLVARRRRDSEAAAE